MLERDGTVILRDRTFSVSLGADFGGGGEDTGCLSRKRAGLGLVHAASQLPCEAISPSAVAESST